MHTSTLVYKYTCTFICYVYWLYWICCLDLLYVHKIHYVILLCDVIIHVTVSE